MMALYDMQFRKYSQTQKDLDDDGNEKSEFVHVIKDQCYAQVVQTQPISDSIASQEFYQ